MSVKVKDIMKKNVITVDPEITVSDASKIMTNNRVGCVILLKAQKPIGIVTDSDIVKLVALGKDAGSTKVLDICSKNFVSARPGEEMLEVVHRMVKMGVKRLPVIERGRLIGIISDKEILITAPELIYILSEKLKTRVSSVATPSMEISGICEGCGGYSDELKNVSGRWLCEDCRLE